MLKINIIGAGLAGSECALYLANKGYKVNLYDIKEKQMTPAHHSKDFAEVVCSNSFKSDDEKENLKELQELERLELQDKQNKNSDDEI